MLFYKQSHALKDVVVELFNFKGNIFDHMCNNVVYVMTQNPKIFSFCKSARDEAYIAQK